MRSTKKTKFIPVNNDLNKAIAFANTLDLNNIKNVQRIKTKEFYIPTLEIVTKLQGEGWHISRGGELRAKKLESTNVATLGKFISDNVAEGSRVNTDEWLGYRKLHKMFDHRVVNHKSHQYVEGDVHTNTLEGFWALFKRGIRGVYHLMSAKHMQKYVDEFVFRYNTRDFSEYHRFNTMLDRVNVRLKYCDLVK